MEVTKREVYEIPMESFDFKLPNCPKILIMDEVLILSPSLYQFFQLQISRNSKEKEFDPNVR